MTAPAFKVPQQNITADVIIIGAGFGGCYALHEIRRQGYTAKLLDAGSDFGGVWHFNRYPGARVDSETPLYQLNLPKVWNSYNFTQRYPGHRELRDYFSHVAETLDLRKDTIFNTKVTEAKYDSASNSWSFRTEAGLNATSRYAIFAAGSTNKAHIPDFPGIEKFKGSVIHPSAWPEDLDFKGKKIGIIGQGASGLQILQELAREDCHLTVFVRNPCTAIPMRQRSISRQESEALKNNYDAFFDKAKYNCHTGFAHNSCDASFYDESESERQQRYERLWARGGYAFFAGCYGEFSYDKTANAELYQFWAGKARSRISDPIKRDIVAPLEQFQWIGTKRPSLEVDYYEMIDRPNVSLVDLKKTSITGFVDNGVTTSNEVHDLDIVIAATGYDSGTGSIYDMNISGNDGIRLQERWKDGIVTYVGMMVPDLPNAFFLYGPQAPTALANAPPFIELQVEWITKLLKRAKEDKIETLNVSKEASAAWGQASTAIFERLLHRETPSWWNGANIPGKRREPLIWHGGITTWWQECSEALKDWSKFSV